MNALVVQPTLAVDRAPRIAQLKNSPELQLLLCCARRELTREHVRLARELLSEPVNWSLLLDEAQVHRVSPLLYWHCTKTLGFILPAGVAEQFGDKFRANAARNLLLVRDLLNVVELLSSRGLQVIPFKGPTLAESLYGNIALRECVDLDVLIRARDVPDAIRTLVSAGYETPAKVPPARQSAFIASQYEYAFLTPAGTLVELQWRIVPCYFSLALHEEQYWSRIQSATICGQAVNALSREDLLLVLCFHGSKHGWTKLIWLADVAELLASSPVLDWQYVLQHAERAGGLRMLLLGVLLAHRLLASAIPKELEQAIARDRTVGKIADNLCSTLPTQTLPTYVESQMYLLRLRERWQDRLRYAVRFIFTSTPEEWKITDLPPSFSFLYSVLRLLRGIVKGLSVAVGAISNLLRSL